MFLKNIFIAIFALVYISNVQSKQMPPSTGKFFYTDFMSEDVHGVHYIDFLIGNKSREYHKLSVSTSEHEVGIYTTQCPLSYCNV